MPDARARAELEAHLGDVRTREAAARARREHIEQGAAGFRAAQAFAAAAKSEAERNGDRERAQREGMVEDRAAYEASLLEERAAREHAGETRLTTERVELEARLAAEISAEQTEIERAERAAVFAREDGERGVQRDFLESMIAELRETEHNIATRRSDVERALARMTEEPDVAPPHKPVPGTGELISTAILGLFARRPPPIA